MAPPQPSLAQDLPQEPDQDLTSCMHSLRGGVGSNIWLYEPGIILSLHLARSALKTSYGAYARSYKLRLKSDYKAEPITTSRYKAVRYHYMASACYIYRT